MKILITSNGIVNKELEEALEQLTGGNTDLHVAIIPTAGDPIEWIPDPDGDDFIPRLTQAPLYETNPTETESYKEWKGKRGFASVSFVSLRDDPKDIEQKLRRADLIYITGGDVDYLMMQAKKAGLDIYWHELLESGTICVTQSAGSGLLTPNTGFRWWTPDVELDVHRFSVVDFIPIVHHTEDDPEKNHDALADRKKYMEEHFPGGFPWPLYLIPDGQGVLIDGNTTKQVGPGEKKIIE